LLHLPFPPPPHAPSLPPVSLVYTILTDWKDAVVLASLAVREKNLCFGVGRAHKLTSFQKWNQRFSAQALRPSALSSLLSRKSRISHFLWSA
jgi:hypothetical protein